MKTMVTPFLILLFAATFTACYTNKHYRMYPGGMVVEVTDEDHEAAAGDQGGEGTAPMPEEKAPQPEREDPEPEGEAPKPKAREGQEDKKPSREEYTTAKEVIAANLEATGGTEQIEGIRSMILQGVQGLAFMPPTQEATLYIKKPGLFKAVDPNSVFVYQNGTCVLNVGGNQQKIFEGPLGEMRYQAGFVLACYTLLKWKEHFDEAEFEGKKRYGPHEEYVLKFPGAEGGRDLTVHVNAETLLLDRLVYCISHPKAKTLKVVNRLREYKEYEGVMIPTVIYSDKVGWEEAPTQFVTKKVELNPEIADAFFEETGQDFGTVTFDGASLRGEIRGNLYGFPQTNISKTDMKSLGVKDRDWVRFTIGETTIKVRYLEAIPRDGGELNPEDIYLCQYGEYPRLMVISREIEAKDIIPFKTGDEVIVALIETEKKDSDSQDP